MIGQTLPSVLIVGFDGLRPDFLHPDVTPNLLRLASMGVRFGRHRSVFPTETRVNMTSLGSGAWPDAHGIIGNRFYDSALAPARWVDCGSVCAMEAAYASGLVSTQTLGDVLQQAGRRMAVIGTGSPGATRLLNPRAPQYGHFSLACDGIATSCPDDAVREVTERFGMPPARALPDTAIIEWATQVFLEHVWPRLRPDVTILWFVEPDMSAHYLGLASENTRQALHAADAAFGLLLDWWERTPGVRLIAASDHGHVAQTHAISAAPILSGLGLSRSLDEPGRRGVFMPGHVGRVYLDKPDPGLLDSIAETLAAQPWCGPMFVQGGTAPAGCLPLALLHGGHARAPDLTYTLLADDGECAPGIPGRVPYDGDIGPGAGYHGGLHRRETNSLLLMAGEGLCEGVTTAVPSAITDVVPTILDWLGLPSPPEGGRILSELNGEAPEWSDDTQAAGRAGYRQVLRRFRVGNRWIIDEASATG